MEAYNNLGTVAAKWNSLIEEKYLDMNVSEETKQLLASSLKNIVNMCFFSKRVAALSFRSYIDPVFAVQYKNKKETLEALATIAEAHVKSAARGILNDQGIAQRWWAYLK